MILLKTPKSAFILLGMLSLVGPVLAFRLAAEPRGAEARVNTSDEPAAFGKELFERGQPRVYAGEHLGAIRLPLGGIGGGNVQIDGKARLRIWQIFNNFEPVAIPHSFFAVRAAVAGGKPVVRAIQTEPVGPFPAMKSLTFRGEYPFGWFEFQEPALPVRVSLEAFSPLIPMDAKNSALPCAIFNITVENTSGKPVEIALLASQQNAVGYQAPPSKTRWGVGGPARNRRTQARGLWG